jgi:hypothetical protein
MHSKAMMEDLTWDLMTEVRGLDFRQIRPEYLRGVVSVSSLPRSFGGSNPLSRTFTTPES